MEQDIRSIVLETEKVESTHKDTYEFRKDRGWRGVQKACIFLLKKIGAYHLGSKTSYTRVDIDTNDLMFLVHKQRQELWRSYNREAKILLIGAPDFEDLMHTSGIRHMLVFSATTHVGRPQALLGMDVHVVPWMRGILVLPDLGTLRC